MDENLPKAHEDQIREDENGKRKIHPRPEFILDSGEPVTDVRNYPGIIVFESDAKNADEEELEYRVECHVARDDNVHSDIAYYEETKDTKIEALECATERLGEEIPTAKKGIINEIDITATLK